MQYYEIALPVKPNQLFTYKSEYKINQGCRVLVLLANRPLTGIVWGKCVELDPKIRYKKILEVVDEKAKIDASLLKLAAWISKYYQCSLGMTLAAMLPSAFNVQLQQQIRLIEQKVIPESDGIPELIIKNLSKLTWQNIDEVKANLQLPATQFHDWLEYLEEKEIVEIKRLFDNKIKKKIANFVILSKIEELPKLTAKQEEAYQYICGLGQEFPLANIARQFSYSIVKALRNKGLLHLEPREVRSQPINSERIQAPKDIELNSEQLAAIAEIHQAVTDAKFKAFLLYGITGSGKTEVYIEAIKKVRASGKTALMLVPEIALTPQMEERFFNAFDEEIAILHSHLNDRERWQAWKKIKSGSSKIVIGARSAIFAPLENLGIVIVDEEHENSYKQDSNPRYNGRDVAVVRAKLAAATIILGSATPSLESWANAQKQRYQLLKLTKRPVKVNLPTAKIIDMRHETDHKEMISQELAAKIMEKMERKEQIILLQNRRGHSSFVQCVTCGKLFECPNCDISLKYHSLNKELICHYCGNKINLPRKCPDCGSYVFNFGSAGTQQLEKIIEQRFPTARILRMDSDTAHKKDSYDSMFERMRNGHVDILLGTQMIAKGLDFPNVTLVGVVSADIGLSFPDFRAAEKTFQLITQVAGRCGRGEKPGEVIIQTYNPQHYAIVNGMKQDFENFSKIELQLRTELNYPPAYRIGRVIFSSDKNERFLIDQLKKNSEIITQLRNLIKPKQLYVLGPTPAPMTKLQNKYRYHLVLKAASAPVLSKAMNFLRQNLILGGNIQQTYDIDPYNLL
ncbi:MAG: primosomal protein N' [Candidatus Cloacimonadales bacterium]